MARLLEADLDRAAYRSVLEKMWGFYSPLEARLGLSTAAGYAYRPRVPLLARDLAFLGTSSADLAACRRLPGVDSESRVWGCLYVLEGAALGGRVILKHVTRSLKVSPVQGAAFFAGNGLPGSQWKRYCAALEAAAPAEPEAVAASAAETFEALFNWLQA